MNNDENLTVFEIEELIDFAWQRAIKYRFDPIASRIHEEYLSMMKNIKEKKTQKTRN